MTTFDEFLYKAKTVAQAAGKKTEEWVEVAKLKCEVVSLQKEQSTTFEGMGRLWYDAQKSGKDVGEMLRECAAHIDELEVRIADVQDRILQHKDAVRCKACNEANPIDSVYCRKCGANIAE